MTCLDDPKDSEPLEETTPPVEELEKGGGEAETK
jgi:hypothetical protein